MNCVVSKSLDSACDDLVDPHTKAKVASKDRINPPQKPGVKIESWGCFGPIPTSYPSTQRATSKSTPKCNGGIVPEQPNNSVHALSVLRKCAPCSQASKRKKCQIECPGLAEYAPALVVLKSSQGTRFEPRPPLEKKNCQSPSGPRATSLHHLRRQRRMVSKESDCRLQMPKRAWGAQERAVQISDSRFQMPPNCKVA